MKDHCWINKCHLPGILKQSVLQHSIFLRPIEIFSSKRTLSFRFPYQSHVWNFGQSLKKWMQLGKSALLFNVLCNSRKYHFLSVAFKSIYIHLETKAHSYEIEHCIAWFWFLSDAFTLLFTLREKRCVRWKCVCALRSAFESVDQYL